MTAQEKKVQTQTAEPNSKEVGTMAEEVKVSVKDPKVQEVLRNNQLNKSEKIRRLCKLGLTKYQVAKVLGVRYQFVYNVMWNEGLKSEKK